MSPWFDLMVEQERRRQEIAQVAEHRYHKRLMSREGRFDSRRNFLRRRYALVLASLGDHLVLWGQRLQNRYEHFSEKTTFGAEQLELVSEQGADSSNCP